jgi:serine O-acetyltransferase
VLIAPNAYVNIDIPANSIVIGNPAKIISKEDPTAGYILSCPEV